MSKILTILKGVLVGGIRLVKYLIRRVRRRRTAALHTAPLKVGDLVEFRLGMEVGSPVRVGIITDTHNRNCMYDYIIKTNHGSIRIWLILESGILAVKRDKKWVTYETQ